MILLPLALAFGLAVCIGSMALNLRVQAAMLNGLRPEWRADPDVMEATRRVQTMGVGTFAGSWPRKRIVKALCFHTGLFAVMDLAGVRAPAQAVIALLLGLYLTSQHHHRLDSANQLYAREHQLPLPAVPGDRTRRIRVGLNFVFELSFVSTMAVFAALLTLPLR